MIAYHLCGSERLETNKHGFVLIIAALELLQEPAMIDLVHASSRSSRIYVKLVKPGRHLGSDCTIMFLYTEWLFLQAGYFAVAVC